MRRSPRRTAALVTILFVGSCGFAVTTDGGRDSAHDDIIDLHNRAQIGATVVVQR